MNEEEINKVIKDVAEKHKITPFKHLLDKNTDNRWVACEKPYVDSYNIKVCCFFCRTVLTADMSDLLHDKVECPLCGRTPKVDKDWVAEKLKKDSTTNLSLIRFRGVNYACNLHCNRCNSDFSAHLRGERESLAECPHCKQELESKAKEFQEYLDREFQGFLKLAKIVPVLGGSKVVLERGINILGPVSSVCVDKSNFIQSIACQIKVLGKLGYSYQDIME